MKISNKEGTMHGNKLVYGFTNCAYYNRRAEGDTSYFLTREERDAALERLRQAAMRHGLSRSGAFTGIYPVKARFGALPQGARDHSDAVGVL
jgi:hypothetical protein